MPLCKFCDAYLSEGSLSSPFKSSCWMTVVQRYASHTWLRGAVCNTRYCFLYLHTTRAAVHFRHRQCVTADSCSNFYNWNIISVSVFRFETEVGVAYTILKLLLLKYIPHQVAPGHTEKSHGC